MSERVVLADIGWCIAKLSLDNDGLAVSLLIASPADTNGERYAPSESVCIYGRGNIATLLAFLRDNLHAEELVSEHRQGVPIETMEPIGGVA